MACVISGVDKSEIRYLPFIDDSRKEIPLLLRGYSNNPIVKKLSNWNDGITMLGVSGKPKSFKWIASYIERYM